MASSFRDGADVPLAVRLGTETVYGDVEAFVCGYVEPGTALRDWLRLWSLNMLAWEEWERLWVVSAV